MTTYESLLVSRRETDSGAIATLTLNRPQRKNALNPTLINEVLHALQGALDDDAVRVVVLDGAGGNFCAGADLTGSSGQSDVPFMGDFADLLRVMMGAPKPLVAKVRGAAVGGGVGLAAACHFALAEVGTTFATPEVHRGLWPMMIMAVLARTVTRRHLLELMLLGQKFTAERAESLGIVNRVEGPGELDAAVDALTNDLATRSPTAMRKGLEAWSKQGDMALAESLPMLRDALSDLFATDDAREGMSAFLEKRPPRWTGR